MKRSMRVLRKTSIGFLSLFLIMNIITFIHAYKFTHFTTPGAKERTKDPQALSAITKARILFTGIDNPKPTGKQFPTLPYTTLFIESDVTLEAWHIKAEQAKGTVILFHGYAGEKSSLVGRAEIFTRLGFNTLLVDFVGSGGSEGRYTTIGYTEAREVKDCYDHIKASGEQHILLFGTSMGAAAILKAVDNYELKPVSLILECPFGSLYKTVCARFDLMGIPSFPMAGMLTFWGGLQHGYWAFAHNPQEYANAVECPTLLLFGEKDNRVSLEETQAIFRNLGGKKVLISYPQEGHHIFTPRNIENWSRDVAAFINSVPALSPQPHQD